MTMTAKTRIGTLIVPCNNADPTRSARPVNRMFRDIQNRCYLIKVALKNLFDERLTGQERASNARSYAVHGNVIYQLNAGTQIYDMSAPQLVALLQRFQLILDDALLEGGNNSLWALQYVAAEYERGTHQAFTNLSVKSPIYEQQTTLQQLLSSPAYQNQVAAAYVSTYSDWSRTGRAVIWRM